MINHSARKLEGDDASVQTALHLIAQVEKAHLERKSADALIARFGDALELILPDLPAATGQQVRQRLDYVRGTRAPVLSRGGEFFDNVVALFRNNPKSEWTIPEIQNELAKNGQVDSKTLHNTVNYLAKSGRLRRIARGQYVVVDLGAGLVGDGIRDDGTNRASEHD